MIRQGLISTLGGHAVSILTADLAFLLSGVVIMASSRRNGIAGPPVGLVNRDGGLAAGRSDLAWEGLERALLDLELILARWCSRSSRPLCTAGRDP